MTTTTRPAALVTGASRGIGLAIAERLAASGHDLTVCARKPDALAAAAGALAAHGVAVHAEPADMAAEDDVHRLAAAHREVYGRLDVLVVAAGVGTAGPLESAPPHRIDKQFAVNVRAPYTLVRAVLPMLRASAAERPELGAKIIMLSSITGVYPEPGLAAYGASKAALISLCRSLNAELSPDGVTATAICPGYVDTDMSAWVHDRVAPSDMIRTSDVAELALSLTRLSSRAVVPDIVITRPGGQLHRA